MKKKLLSIVLLISFGVNAQFWTEKATGFNTQNRSLHSISIVDANTIWAIAYDNNDPLNPHYSPKEFTKSTDGGETWTPGTMNLGPDADDMDASSITAVSATTAWISLGPGSIITSGGIWKTTDGGTNWTKQETALFNTPSSYSNFVHFWDANNGVAQGDPENGEFEIYTTIDGGDTWVRVPGENIPDPDLIDGEYGYNNRYTVYGNTIWFGTTRGRIFKSSDKGLTWVVYDSTYSHDFGLDRFTFSDENKGLLTIYADPVTIYNTIDGGATWNFVSSGAIYNTDITYIPGTSKVISASRANPLGSSYSLDDGLSWTTIDVVFHGELAFLNDSFGFSAGLNTDATTGGIFKYTGTVLSTPGFNINTQVSIYPNPTNGILHIDSANTQVKEASVFDLLGRQVHSSKFSPLNNVTLDLNSLQTGNYILKTTSDSGATETTKILKN